MCPPFLYEIAAARGRALTSADQEGPPGGKTGRGVLIRKAPDKFFPKIGPNFPCTFFRQFLAHFANLPIF